MSSMFQWASGEFMHCQKSTPELLTLCMVLNLRNSAAAGGHTARRERHTMRTVAVQHSHVCVRALASAGERWRAHRTQKVGAGIAMLIVLLVLCTLTNLLQWAQRRRRGGQLRFQGNTMLRKLNVNNLYRSDDESYTNLLDIRIYNLFWKLVKMKAKPSNSAQEVFVHGDLNFDNVMFR